jgi:hypothetical protein
MSKTKILGSFERVAQANDLSSLFEGAALRLTLNTSTSVVETVAVFVVNFTNSYAENKTVH